MAPKLRTRPAAKTRTGAAQKMTAAGTTKKAETRSVTQGEPGRSAAAQSKGMAAPAVKSGTAGETVTHPPREIRARQKVQVLLLVAPLAVKAIHVHHPPAPLPAPTGPPHQHPPGGHSQQRHECHVMIHAVAAQGPAPQRLPAGHAPHRPPLTAQLQLRVIAAGPAALIPLFPAAGTTDLLPTIAAQGTAQQQMCGAAEGQGMEGYTAALHPWLVIMQVTAEAAGHPCTAVIEQQGLAGIAGVCQHPGHQHMIGIHLT
jgi:hypothetical protein